MTCVWAWADLGNHTLQFFNIRQYWLIMSVLSVKKFNPNWKRVFFVDKQTYDFLNSKKWIYLWDEVNIVDFKNTEYGNLYDISIYSWPKIYSYGLLDDDILIMDVDIVFVKKMGITDFKKIGGNLYNHMDDFISDYNSDGYSNLSHKWDYIDLVQSKIIDGDYEKLKPTSICIIGSPIYCPKHLNKKVQQILNHIIRVENIYGGLLPFDTYQALEEEYPIAQIAVDNGGFWQIDTSCYKHGYISEAFFDIHNGYDEPERLLNEPVFKKYIINE